MALIQTVPPDKAEGDIEKVYSMMKQTAGEIPLPLQMMSVSPAIFGFQSQFINYFMNHPNLEFPLLAHIRYLVSVEYDYRFCAAFNRNLLKMQGLEDQDIEKLAADPSEALLEEKDKAMLMFVLKSIKTPESVEQKDVDALHDLGWTDTDIFDALFHGAGMLVHSIMMKAFKMDE